MKKELPFICILIVTLLLMLRTNYVKAQNSMLLYESFDYYRVSGNIEKAKFYANKLQLQIEKEFADIDTMKALYYAQLAIFYNSIKVKDTSLLYTAKTDSLFKISYGKDHTFELGPEWIYLFKKALKDSQQGNYYNAIVSIHKSMEIIEKDSGKYNESYTVCLGYLAFFYCEIQDFEKAKEQYLHALGITNKLYGKDHLNYSKFLLGLAIVYDNLGDYEKAAPLVMQALTIRKNVLGDKHPDYAECLTSLAISNRERGNYAKAESLEIEALRIIKDTLGENHPKYATSLNDLAEIYSAMELFEKAESLFIKAIVIRKKILGEDDPDYAASLNGLAVLYRCTGNYSKSELLFNEALVIRKKVLGPNNLDYAASLCDISVLYLYMKEYKKAELSNIEAASIYKKILGENHFVYSTCINNLAIVYRKTGYYEKAEPLYIEALNIRKKTLGEEHLEYAKSLNNLADLYNHMRKFYEAEPLLIKSISIYKKVLGKNNFACFLPINSLAVLYSMIGDNEKAESSFLEANSILNFQLSENAKFMSENERTKFMEFEINFSYDVLHSFYLTKRKENKKLAGLIYDNVLVLKGQLLRSAVKMRKAILQSNDTSLINRYDNLNYIGNMLANQYMLPIRQRRSDISKLEEQVNSIEKELVHKSQEFKILENSAKINWESVQKSLSENEAAIEFIDVCYYSGRELELITDTTFYYALVLKKGMNHPEAIFLCEKKQIIDLLNKYKNGKDTSDFALVTQLYNNRNLYDLIWRPLDSLLKNINTVYISPSDILNKISFSAILADENNRLSDKYKISCLISTSSLIRKKSTQINLNSIALFGGIRYTIDSVSQQGMQNVINKSGIITTSSKDKPWSYMPSSKEEVIKISELCQIEHVSTKLLTDTLATEESFKKLNNISPDIIHISTHGFYNSNSSEAQYQNLQMMDNSSSRDPYNYSENPLIRSGLIFAGIGNVVPGNSQISGNDGILTALEISNLNLTGTKLIVTSACETALGDIQGSEGVFGLQRGFKIAGVDNLIITLWDVSAQHTKEFMITFYKNLFNSQSIHNAFYTTQTEMKNKYPNPYFWAAFVLIE